jgi:hypothetical protein
VLIDSGHRRWMIGTASAALALGGLYCVLDRSAVQPLTGGTTIGLWYGVGGTALMIYAGLLAAHRRLARWPFLPRRAWFLKGHIWLGLLSVLLILCHSGFRWGGPLEQALWMTLGLVVASGILGLVLQGVLPRLLTERVAAETPYEQMPHVCRQLTKRAVQIVDEICGSRAESARSDSAKGQLRAYFDEAIEPFMLGTNDNSAPTQAGRTQDRLSQFQRLPDLAEHGPRLQELDRLCEQRRQIAEQERLHHWLHGWLLVHVPLSVALLILGTAHVVMSLYY